MVWGTCAVNSLGFTSLSVEERRQRQLAGTAVLYSDMGLLKSHWLESFWQRRATTVLSFRRIRCWYRIRWIRYFQPSLVVLYLQKKISNCFISTGQCKLSKRRLNISRSSCCLVWRVSFVLVADASNPGLHRSFADASAMHQRAKHPEAALVRTREAVAGTFALQSNFGTGRTCD